MVFFLPKLITATLVHSLTCFQSSDCIDTWYILTLQGSLELIFGKFCNFIFVSDSRLWKLSCLNFFYLVSHSATLVHIQHTSRLPITLIINWYLSSLQGDGFFEKFSNFFVFGYGFGFNTKTCVYLIFLPRLTLCEI